MQERGGWLDSGAVMEKRVLPACCPHPRPQCHPPQPGRASNHVRYLPSTLIPFSPRHQQAPTSTDVRLGPLFQTAQPPLLTTSEPPTPGARPPAAEPRACALRRPNQRYIRAPPVSLGPTTASPPHVVTFAAHRRSLTATD